MNEWNLTPRFEEDIRQSFNVPEIRSEFLDQLHGEIMQRADAKTRKPHNFLTLRPAWTLTLAVLAVLIIGTLIIGPQRVYAAVRQFLVGYIPGIGIVDQSSPIRVLEEPVTVTRDGITVSVNQAVLTSMETRLEFGVSGVPLSAYPEGEAVSGCMDQHYLLLADGTKLAINDLIPSAVNEAVFILPCIFNTLPGTVPTDWELPLHFVAAPPDLTILPVIEVAPQATPTVYKPDLNSEILTPTVSDSNNVTVSVDQIIETEDGYILLGSVRPHIPEGSWLQITGAATIRDADGKKVSYSFPNDVQPLDDADFFQGGYSWVMQIKGTGVKFPLTISFSGVVISQIDSRASARLTVDVGTNPQAGQVWEVNQAVQLAGHTIRLVSITADSRNGYSFRIDPGADLSGASVQIEGYQAVGGGGGSGWQGAFNTSLAYNELPAGQLTLLFTNPLTASPTETWQTQWKPEKAQEFTPSAHARDICWNADTIQTIPLLPAGLDGLAVITQLNPQLRIVLSGIDGKQQRIIATNTARGALTLDGTFLAYSTDLGIEIQDFTSGDHTVMTGIFGRDLHWSPDGNWIAYVNSGNAYGIFVIDRNGESSKQLSSLGYESIAGWSPDGSTLYYAIPGSTGNGFLLRSVEMVTGNTQDMFILENSSLKAPLPAVSPDGKWIAYRASDNSSLYIMGVDGSQARLLLDNPALAINGIAWEKESHLLGVSLITAQYPDGEIILIAPDSCETYLFPGLSGELDGIFIP